MTWTISSTWMPRDSDVGGHQNAIAPLLESGERRVSLGLRAIAVDGGGGEAVAVERLGQLIGRRAWCARRPGSGPSPSTRSRRKTSYLPSGVTSKACRRTFSEGLRSIRRRHAPDSSCSPRPGASSRLRAWRRSTWSGAAWVKPPRCGEWREEIRRRACGRLRPAPGCAGARKSRLLRSRKSSRRPGVATTRRAPRRSAASCGPSAKPPTTTRRRRKLPAAQARHTESATCMASSRVGTSTSAVTPGAFSRRSCSITGIRNASVLPVPVCAVASTSWPSRAWGIVRGLHGRGRQEACGSKRSFTYGEICNSEKLCTLLSFLWPQRGERAHGFASVDRNEDGQFGFKLGRRFTEETARRVFSDQLFTEELLISRTTQP